jgi:hypothetical protein
MAGRGSPLPPGRGNRWRSGQVSEKSEKAGRTDNRDPVKGLQGDQVLVTADDVVGAGCRGRFEDAVVSWTLLSMTTVTDGFDALPVSAPR